MSAASSALWADLEPLPLPGLGDTPGRFDALFRHACASPAIARLLEAHFDAVAILAELGIDSPADWRLGVWAAGGPTPLDIVEVDGRRRLRGEKSWCSGASLVSHALVSVGDGSASQLLLVDMSTEGIEILQPDWVSEAFAEVDTRTVAFDIDIDACRFLGQPGWYLDRPGFWHGAVGVAACWAGSAAGLVARVADRWKTDPHAVAHLGAIDADVWSMLAVLHEAGREIDSAPTDVHAAVRRARRLRHLVDVAAADITTRLARALGPGPLAYQPDLHLVLSEVDLYRRQCHAERDLEALGRLVLDSPTPELSTPLTAPSAPADV